MHKVPRLQKHVSNNSGEFIRAMMLFLNRRLSMLSYSRTSFLTHLSCDTCRIGAGECEVVCNCPHIAYGM